MQYTSKFKLIILIALVFIGAYFVAINIQNLGKLSIFSSVENIVEADDISSPTPVTIKTANFRPDGGYELSSKSTRGFDEIVWLSVITGTGVGHGSACFPEPCEPPKVEKKVDWIPQTPRGLLVTKNNHYEWRDENLSADRISFTTKKYKGISYQFNGHFLSNENFEVSRPEDAILKGRLIKLVKGQNAKDEEVEFNWFSWNEVDRERYLRIKPSVRKK